MLVLASSSEYMLIPVTGPAGLDVTTLPVDIALIADPGTEPGAADWHAGTWLAGQAALLLGALGTPYSPGEYMCYVRLTAGAEKPVIASGRVRVGDARG